MGDNKIDIEVTDEEDNVVDLTKIDTNESEVRAFDDEASSRLKELQGKYEAESRRARDLEARLDDVMRFAHGAFNETKRLSSLLNNGERVLIDQASARVKVEMAAAEEAFKKAYDEGDTEAMLKANKAIAELTHQMKQVESYTPGQNQPMVQAPPPQPRHQGDPKSDAWLKRNESWWMKDEPMTAFAMGVHSELIKNGVVPGTDAYIEGLDRRMAETFPNKFQSAGNSPRQRTASGQSAVAPATRTAGGKTASKVIINPAMKAKMSEQARRLNVPVELYIEEYIKEYGNG